jgi:hypothetical protein
MLGIESLRQELHGVHARLAAQIHELQSQQELNHDIVVGRLATVQIGQRYYTDEQIENLKRHTPKTADLFKVMDYETSQIAALDEFKEK